YTPCTTAAARETKVQVRTDAHRSFSRQILVALPASRTDTASWGLVAAPAHPPPFCPLLARGERPRAALPLSTRRPPRQSSLPAGGAARAAGDAQLAPRPSLTASATAGPSWRLHRRTCRSRLASSRGRAAHPWEPLVELQRVLDLASAPRRR